MNESLFRLVILGLVSVSCLSIVGIIVVASFGQKPPEVLGLVVTAAVGGLCTILVKPPNAPPSGVGGVEGKSLT